MRRTIYKYPLKRRVSNEIELPKNSIVLDIQKQNGEYVLWAEVDLLEKETELLFVTIFGTGSIMLTDYGKHIKTIQDDKYVWHFYIKTQSKESVYPATL